MDELPNELRNILELARDEHDPPDDQARQRVRVALAAAIGVPAGGAVLSGGKAAAMGSKAPGALVGATKAGWLALGGKLTMAALGSVAAAGIGFAVYSARTPVPVATPVVAPAVQPYVPAVPAPLLEQPPAPQVTQLAAPTVVEAAADSARPPAKSRKVAPPVEARSRAREQRADTLNEETALLRAASEALAEGDEERALVQLHTHAKLYARGSLREERDGLRAIAECTRDHSPSQQAAQRFAQLYPNSLLTARVAAACRAR